MKKIHRENLYIINPYIRIILDPLRKSMFLLKNVESGSSFYISRDFIEFIINSSKPDSLYSFSKYIQKKFKSNNKKTEQIINMIVEKQILVKGGDFQKKIQDLSKWVKYNWLFSLDYLMDSENSQPFLDKKSLLPQNVVLRSYLKKERPQFYKKYNLAKKVSLNKDMNLPEFLLKDVLFRRRTSRSFSSYFRISIKELGTILYYACQELKTIRDAQSKIYKSDPSILLRSIFTPFEIYIVVNKVEKLGKGIYHYNASNHSLEKIREGNFAHKISLLAHGEMFLEDTGVVVLISAIFKRFMFRYRYSRAYSELLIGASHLAHLIILWGTALNIKTFETPALLDSKVCRLLNLDGWNEDVLYLVALGK